jgi:polar amino acid transport system substrate-binding protein
VKPFFIVAALAAALAVAGCQYPKDVEGTLDRVEGGAMRVGVSDHEPWVNLDGDRPAGVEPTLIRQFAETLDAEIRWVQGDAEELVGALQGGQLDVVLAGFTRRSEFRRKVALTRPYVDTELLIAHPPGQPLPKEESGVEVAVLEDSEDAALLDHKTDYKGFEVKSVEGFNGPVLAWDYWLDDLGYQSTGQDLIDEEHAMAVRLGENAMMVELERFLLDREGEIRGLVNREGKP